MISASRAQLFLETVHGLQSDVVTWRSSSGAWFLVSKNHLELDFHLGCVVIIVILFLIMVVSSRTPCFFPTQDKPGTPRVSQLEEDDLMC